MSIANMAIDGNTVSMDRTDGPPRTRLPAVITGDPFADLVDRFCQQQVAFRARLAVAGLLNDNHRGGVECPPDR